MLDDISRRQWATSRAPFFWGKKVPLCLSYDTSRGVLGKLVFFGDSSLPSFGVFWPKVQLEPVSEKIDSYFHPL